MSANKNNAEILAVNTRAVGEKAANAMRELGKALHKLCDANDAAAARGEISPDWRHEWSTKAR